MSGARGLASIYRSTQFLRFLAVGGIALALHWLSRFAFSWFVSFGWAIVLAYLVGMLVAFLLNKAYVFPFSSRPLEQEAFFFFLVNVGAFPAVWIVAYGLGEYLLSRWMQRPVALALGHAAAIVLPVFVTFALHKFVTFREA